MSRLFWLWAPWAIQLVLGELLYSLFCGTVATSNRAALATMLGSVVSLDPLPADGTVVVGLVTRREVVHRWLVNRGLWLLAVRYVDIHQ